MPSFCYFLKYEICKSDTVATAFYVILFDTENNSDVLWVSEYMCILLKRETKSTVGRVIAF